MLNVQPQRYRAGSCPASRLTWARQSALLMMAVLALAGCGKQPSDALPELTVDPGRVAVAGLSSGAYMATQSHMAWPALFSGAALVAGGPYGCAAGELARAMSSCMKGKPAIDVQVLAASARDRAAAGALGALDGLAGDRVYVLHGRRDEVVAEAVSRWAADFYRALQPALHGEPMTITLDAARDFAHELPHAGADGGFDAAGAIFTALFGAARRAPTTARGTLHRFDQNALLAPGGDAFLADVGYLYVPPACADGAACGLLVAFHGCEQNAEAVGTGFVAGSGFNRQADAYQVVVLYPQTRASFMPLNPKACWDWWGYSGAGYDTRAGVQQQWLRKALTALGVP